MKEITNIKDTALYYYDMLRDNQDKIIQKLEEHLTFYRFSYKGKFKSQEVIYDTPTNLLASAGLVISKIYEDDKYYMVVTKVSYLPKQFKKPSVILFKAECTAQDVPNMYPIKLGGVISDSNPSIFTVDLVEVIKIVVPKIQIEVKGDRYDIASGSGYKAEMRFENVFYKDIKSKVKFNHKNVVFALSAEPKEEKDNREVRGAVLRYCKELFPYDETRFEIARRVLMARMGTKKKISKKELLEQQKKKEQQDKENQQD